MINEITDIQNLEQVSGGASLVFRQFTSTVNGVTTTTTEASGDSGGISSSGTPRSRFEARRAEFRARRAAAEAEEAANPSTGGRRGFPASAALGLP